MEFKITHFTANIGATVIAFFYGVLFDLLLLLIAVRLKKMQQQGIRVGLYEESISISTINGA